MDPGFLVVVLQPTFVKQLRVWLALELGIL